MSAKREYFRLTPLTVKKQKTPGLHPDGDGLYLKVTATGGKTWLVRFKINKRPREMGLGAYPAISLKDARSEAQDARKLLHEGIDPIEHRRALRAAQERSAIPTFQELAQSYISDHSGGWRNAKHHQQWTNTLKTYAFPVIGKLPVDEIQLNHILEILKPIWSTKTETATRVRQRIENILDAALVMGHRTEANPARWKGNLQHLMSAPEKTTAVEHHPALPYRELPALMHKLENNQGLSALALRFTILTAARTTEVLHARWDEFDLEGGLWIVPGNRMKAGKEHRVPLSQLALDILQPLYDCREGDNAYVFPGAKPRKPLSGMSMLMTLKRIQSGFTVHGFRSTFRDWCAEETTYHPDLAEAALAHVIGNRTRAAYERGDKLERRRELMKSWALYCVKPQSSDNVVQLKSA